LVLKNRGRLVELARELARVEKRVAAGSSRKGAAAAVFSVVATLAVLAVMSWEIAARAWPGTYVARAVLEADTGRATPKPEDLAVWQKDQAELLGDPRLAEVASQRMRQRGLISLGAPADLAARIKQDMYVQSVRPGSITVELRGEGAEKTFLALDTLVTAFKALSDQGRDERANDIGITIAQAAKADDQPLMDQRIERAGAVFGGSALAASLAGLVVWTRLVKAKNKYEQAAAVEAALDGEDWTGLEESMRGHAARGSVKGKQGDG
jgi:hypothetical protein